MLTALFWLLVILSIYSYFLYPLLLKTLTLLPIKTGALKKTPRIFGNSLSISLIITAHNEENRIRAKLENSLKINFDKDCLEIIVASDNSEDTTDNIVDEYQDQGIKLVRANERLGKENAQRCAIEVATGDIIVFSDVATEIPEDALMNIAHYFNDPNIGAVSSEDRFINSQGTIAGEGAYVKYEMWLRQQESNLAGIVGLSGSFFAARKDVCQTWDIHSPSDFNTALNCAQLGYRAVTAPDVLGYYQDLKDSSKEYARKIRTVIRGMTALQRHPEVLNPFKYGLFSFQVISHKLMRWLVPWLLIALLIVNLMLFQSGGIYIAALILQGIFYGIALSAHYKESLLNISQVKLIYFFVQVNLALFDASCQFLAGKRMSIWQPSAR
jgi:cellulose synthase/poly-beta-1,6-N-acetylglucosamine synthase-like glycosyltransferase